MLDALELRAPPSQGGLGEVSRAITQVFLVTHFTSGEPALVIPNGLWPIGQICPFQKVGCTPAKPKI